MDVLVADNDPGVRALLAEVLRRRGLAVGTADDGEAARRELQGGRVAVLVCDLDMPGLSGAQLLAWLATQPSPPQVVVVSGYLDARTGRELDQLPFVRAQLRKPFDVLAFVDLVRQLVTPPAAQGTAASG